jgi:hypothetical protein
MKIKIDTVPYWDYVANREKYKIEYSFNRSRIEVTNRGFSTIGGAEKAAKKLLEVFYELARDSEEVEDIIRNDRQVSKRNKRKQSRKP